MSIVQYSRVKCVPSHHIALCPDLIFFLLLCLETAYSYDIFKQSVTSITGGDELSPSIGEKFVAGAAAGAVSQVVLSPLLSADIDDAS